MRSCIPLMRRKSRRDLSSVRKNDHSYDYDDSNADDDDDDDDDDVFVDVSAAKCQSSSRPSRVTSSCDVITPPARISDVDVDVVNTDAVICPGSHYILNELFRDNNIYILHVLMNHSVHMAYGGL